MADVSASPLWVWHLQHGEASLEVHGWYSDCSIGEGEAADANGAIAYADTLVV